MVRRNCTAPLSSSAQCAPGATVGHADAAGVDDQSTKDKSGEGHVRVPTHHSRHRLVHGRQRFSPTLLPGVDQDHLLLVARNSVAENRLAEAVEVTADRVWQGSEQLHLVGTELSCSPGRDGVRNRRRPSTGECDEVTIGVPPHPQHPLAQGDQPIQWVSTGIGPVAMSPVRTISSAATTSGSASTASRPARAVDIGQHDCGHTRQVSR